FLVSKKLSADYERVAIVASRTSVFLVNFGFWVGSLWGDRMRLLRSISDTGVLSGSPATVVSPAAFSIGWAIALFAVGAWGVYANRRWVVNVAAVFGAIHFYTQWFMYLGANAASVLLGGLMLLGLALALRSFNRHLTSPPSAMATPAPTGHA